MCTHFVYVLYLLLPTHQRKSVIYVTRGPLLICKFRERVASAIKASQTNHARCFRKFSIDGKPVVRARSWKPFVQWHKWFWLTRLVTNVCSDAKHNYVHAVLDCRFLRNALCVTFHACLDEMLSSTSPANNHIHLKENQDSYHDHL